MVLSKGLINRPCRGSTVTLTLAFCAHYLSKLDP
jgi:hypothetical protein